MWRWTVRWSNPYTQPPEGEPAILGMMETESTRAPGSLLELYAPGDGYGLFVDRIPDGPPRTWSPEAKARNRTRRREARIRKRWPLFADQFLAEPPHNNFKK